MKQKSELLYLDLMKRTHSFTLWSEPPIPITTFNYGRSPVKRFLGSAISNILDKRKLQIVQSREFSESQRIEGQVWPSYADTMIGLKRLDNLQRCIETVLREGVEGDLIETGVWRGGACIFMRAVLAAMEYRIVQFLLPILLRGYPNQTLRNIPLIKAINTTSILTLRYQKMRLEITLGNTFC